jgi:hypothetical protein
MTVPSLRNPPPEEGISTHNSTGDAFAYHLELKFENNPQLLEIAIKDVFFILSDLYRLVASTWMVANEYLNRECTTIEYVLEKQEANIRDLDTVEITDI